MVKFLGVEFVAEDLKQAGKIINSRIGLAILMWCAFNSPWGISPKIDALIRSNDRVASAVDQTQALGAINHDILVRLMERCEICKKPATPASIDDGKGYTARR